MFLARPIADALQRGATIVAASPRAARALRLRHAATQRADGRTVWPSPSIVDWDSWLRELWRDHAFARPDAPMLLTPLQERAAWMRVQRDDAALVLARESMAALASEAWSLLSAYNAHAARRQAWSSSDAPSDAERFRCWGDEFERMCTRHSWLSASQIATELTAAVENLTLPPAILLVGFDRTTPAQKAWLDALRSRVAIAVFEPGPRPSHRSWVMATDAREEMAACAHWARSLLLENPAARLGVIVPGVAGARGLIDRTLRRVLMPASEDIRQPSAFMPWEFSLGQPLAEVPAVRAALLLLRWIAEPLAEADIRWLLLSGFVAATVTNHLAVAQHDAARRRTGSLLPRHTLAVWCSSIGGVPDLRGLQEALAAVLRTVDANQILSASRPPSAWSELVQLLLERAGWPGQRPADSVQFQAMERWERLLEEMALLDFDGTRCTFEDFLARLGHHAQETIFAPESHDAPVQIMGPFESSGQEFDAVWFLGADDERWPLRGRFHPLLPPAVQRQFGMPHATPDDDWNLAHAVTARLLASTVQVVFSYAERDKDIEHRPSPLIASLFPPGTEPQPTVAPPDGPQAVPMETIEDESGRLPWPREQNAGGADLLRRQAACPFQAFATKRLGAEAIEEEDWGLSPAERGKLLHEVMRRLFTAELPARIRTRDDIVAALAHNQTAAILDVHIDAAMHAVLGPAPSDLWLTAWLDAEKRRLRTRIQEWLACEARRQPFTVEACEQPLHDVHIGELRLNLRTDRIDLLPDGSRFLLDYKTGAVSAAAWKGDRPDEPQLPLYAAYGNVENVSGVLFAKIRAGETGFDGRVRDARAQLCAEMGARKALVTDPYSESMRDKWARALETLAAAFLEGVATVSPREPQVCEHCPLPALCRKAELNIAASETDEEGIDG